MTHLGYRMAVRWFEANLKEGFAAGKGWAKEAKENSGLWEWRHPAELWPSAEIVCIKWMFAQITKSKGTWTTSVCLRAQTISTRYFMEKNLIASDGKTIKGKSLKQYISNGSNFYQKCHFTFDPYMVPKSLLKPRLRHDTCFKSG